MFEDFHLAASLLMYDIPDASGIANPSDRLRQYAVRINLSVWVVPNHNIPYSLLNEMSAAGVEWEVIKFDVSEGGRLAEKAIKAIRRDIQDYVARARASARAAAYALENGDDAPEVMAKRYDRQSSAICRRVNNLLKSMETVAERFGFGAGTLDTGSAHTAVQSIKAGMRERVRLYRQTLDEIRAIGGADANAMADAMEADEVPAEIAADFAEDNGRDASALRTAFER